jgi:DNA-binding GntR family transcriptional regulator
MAIDLTTPDDRAGVPAAGSRAEVADQRLKSAIRSRQFEPGQRMREAEIAPWLGISRTPVRDALELLGSDGLLVAAPRRGLIIAELDQQQVAEIYALRSALEGLAARMAAQHASSAELSALAGVVERQAQAGPDDPAAARRPTPSTWRS